jgi:hypothetical protein
MHRSQRPRSWPRLPRSSYVGCLRMTRTRRRSHCWRSPCRTSRPAGKCSSNSRSGSRMKRPGTKQGTARWTADRAMDMIRDRFRWAAVGYGSVALGLPVPSRRVSRARGKGPLAIAARPRPHRFGYRRGRQAPKKCTALKAALWTSRMSRCAPRSGHDLLTRRAPSGPCLRKGIAMRS